jgi:hypothetical protein
LCKRDSDSSCSDRLPLEEGAGCDSFGDNYTKCKLYVGCDFYENKGCGILTMYNGANGLQYIFYFFFTFFVYFH